jgi:hypothetical protein
MRVILLLVAAACLAAGQKKSPGPLAIQNIELSQYEDGPPVLLQDGFAAGETIFFSFQIANYRIPAEEGDKISLTYEIDAKDPVGIPVVTPTSGKVSTALDPEDKHWMPKVRWTIQLPPYAPPGTFHIAIRVKDLLAKTDAAQQVDFRVRAPEIPASDTLVIRNLAFYRSDTDEKALVSASYRPGDPVWIRFDMTGYKFGEKNHFDVGYGITVLRPDGQPSFSMPDAARENNESFYPRRRLPATFSLNLPKDIQTGQYTVIVTAQDKIGGETAEARSAFSIER